MRVALVFPRAKYPTGDPPLGVAYLAAAMRKATGEAPVIIDTTFAADPAGLVKRELEKERFDLVGISAMVTMAREATHAAREAKRTNPGCKVIVGGPHPTTLPDLVLAEEAVDAVCVGEGEETFVELLEAKDIREVPGIFFRDGGGVKGEHRKPIGDLDQLAFPALDLLDMEEYFNHWFQLDSVKPGLRGTSVLATRGCPFKCAYCQPTLDKLFGKGVRKRSAANVVDELELRGSQFGISGFLFSDDTFIADRKWVMSFCDEILSRGLGYGWGCNVRADLVDEDMLRRMKEAGLAKIYVGIEVYSDENRREIFNKRLTREHVERAVGAAKALGIGTQGYFMLGAPGETPSDAWDTVKYAWRLPIDDATFNLTTPLPGTYLFEKHSGAVELCPEDMDYYKRYSFKPGAGLDERRLLRIQKAAYLGFYMRPMRLVGQLAALFTPGGLQKLWSKIRRVF